MKHFLADWSGNYVFFCPLVIALNHWWNKPEIMVPYLLTSLGVAAFGGRAYTLFLKYAWYPLWKVKF